MQVHFIVQKESGQKKNSIRQQIHDTISKHNLSTARIAVAYATVAGTRQVLLAFNDTKLTESRWVIGLSDLVTHPDALELLFKLKGAEVRIANTADHKTRYHPKVFQFGNEKAKRFEVTFIGSANMTAAALNENVEAVSVLRAENDADYVEFSALWKQLWKIGTPLTAKTLSEYRNKFDEADAIRKASRAKLKKNEKPKGKKASVGAKEVFSTDEAQLDPKLANTCWIEVGKATLFGRELEIKAELAIFFGLNSKSEEVQTFDFKLTNGTSTSLRMKYQTDNGMWRLQMKPTIPEVKKGLRPELANGKLGRSPHVAIFTKTKAPGIFDLKFILESSNAYEALQAKSKLTGTIGQTTTRKYGWCN